MSNPLQQLHDFGQSFWYDNIRRALLRSGELKRMVEQDGLRGLTSNPTIFAKAIASSSDYDATIGAHLADTPSDLFIRLAIEDIQAACDVLRPVFDSSDGQDGFASIEVFPDLAYDAAGTLAQARMLWHEVNRPNVMVKVPSTPECIPVIQQLLTEGINVNITLMFDFAAYAAVIEAHLMALEARLANRESVHSLASVASLFVSRVDVRIDKMLETLAAQKPDQAPALRGLQGRVGIANARRMYRYFLEVCATPRWKKLAAAGARPQRLLWASTGTKNPRFPDTLYVDALIGPDTVDTMPDATLAAFRDHGHPADTLSNALGEVEPVLEGLKTAGIDLEHELRELQTEGVKLFTDSYEELLQGLRDKVVVLREGGIDSLLIEAPAGLDAKAELARLDAAKFSSKVWEADPAAWSSDAAVGVKIRHRLGWLHLSETMQSKLNEIAACVRDCRAAGFQRAVLLGMGGSSLAPEVFRQVFGVAAGALDLVVLDTTDPDTLAHAEAGFDLARTVFIVSSKSGGTIEPNSLLAYFWERIRATVPGATVGTHFIAITDADTSMHHLALEKGFRKIFLNPADIGGRYSALSYFGLVPAALLGIDLGSLLRKTEAMVHSCTAVVPAPQNPAMVLGAALGHWATQGRDKLTFLSSPTLASFGMWLEQLIAESTGKLGKGIVPVDGEAPGAPEVYGNDRVFVRLHLAGETLDEGWKQAIQQAGHPVVTITLRDRFDLGQEMFRWEFATAVAGAVLNINPFDEPNVQESKDNTAQVIATFQASGAAAAGLTFGNAANAMGLRAVAPHAAAGAGPAELLQAWLQLAQGGDYVAVMAYLEASDAITARLQRLRLALRAQLHVATTLGFGPRFLHSTGQLHKGGPNRGLFLQLTAPPTEDRDIPGQTYSFATLLAAQAQGDYQSLVTHQRRVLRIDLGTAVEAGLDQLLQTLHASTAAVLSGAGSR